MGPGSLLQCAGARSHESLPYSFPISPGAKLFVAWSCKNAFETEWEVGRAFGSVADRSGRQGRVLFTEFLYTEGIETVLFACTLLSRTADTDRNCPDKESARPDVNSSTSRAGCLAGTSRPSSKTHRNQGNHFCSSGGIERVRNGCDSNGARG
jgi:hypothetical protein